MLGTVPLVSVITPCHDDGRFLHLPIESVAAQTRSDWEMIVVDDGSTQESTLGVLNAIDHPRIRILHQENRGLPAARNAGIRLARGSFIVPLDADDRIEPEFIERSLLEFERHPEAAVVYGDYRTFGRENRLIRTGQFNTYRILLSNFMPVCAMYRIDAWRAVNGYTESMKGFEDWEFWIKLVERGYQFRKMQEEALYWHHVHDSNMWLRDKASYRKFISQIRSYHPDLYSARSLDRRRRENRATWLEDFVYRLPTPLRHRLRRWPIGGVVVVARRLGMYRDG